MQVVKEDRSSVVIKKIHKKIRVNVLRDTHLLPHITCKLLGQLCSPLLDTGSGVSILSSEFYATLDPKPKLESWGTSVIISASGSDLPIMGKVTIPVLIGTVTTSYEFAVVEKFSYETLFGINILIRGKIDLAKQTYRPATGKKVPLHLVDKEGKPVFMVITGKKLRLKAREVAIIDVDVSGVFDEQVRKSGTCLCFVGNLKSKQIVYACHSVCHQDEHGRIPVALLNPSDRDIILSPTQYLGTLELTEILDGGQNSSPEEKVSSEVPHFADVIVLRKSHSSLYTIE